MEKYQKGNRFASIDLIVSYEMEISRYGGLFDYGKPCVLETVHGNGRFSIFPAEISVFH